MIDQNPEIEQKISQLAHQLLNNQKNILEGVAPISTKNLKNLLTLASLALREIAAEDQTSDNPLELREAIANLFDYLPREAPGSEIRQSLTATAITEVYSDPENLPFFTQNLMPYELRRARNFFEAALLMSENK